MEALDLLTDFVGRPKLDAAELDKERGVVIQEIARDRFNLARVATAHRAVARPRRDRATPTSFRGIARRVRREDKSSCPPRQRGTFLLMSGSDSSGVHE